MLYQKLSSARVARACNVLVCIKHTYIDNLIYMYRQLSRKEIRSSNCNSNK